MVNLTRSALVRFHHLCTGVWWFNFDMHTILLWWVSSTNFLTSWEPVYGIFVLGFRPKNQQFSVAIPTPKFFSSAIYKTGRSVWAAEQLSSAIGERARALVRQPKTFFLQKSPKPGGFKSVYFQCKPLPCLFSHLHPLQDISAHTLFTIFKQLCLSKAQICLNFQWFYYY